MGYPATATPAKTVKPRACGYRCFAHISLLSACNRRAYILLPPPLYRGPRTQPRAYFRHLHSVQKQHSRLVQSGNRATPSRNKKEQRVQRTTPAAWGEIFVNYRRCIQPQQVYRPPLAKRNPTIYSATPQPAHKFCYTSGSGIRPITHTGLHFLANTGYTTAG